MRLEIGRYIYPLRNKNPAPDCGDLLLPRVEDRNSCLVEIAPVARDNRKPVVKGCGRNHNVRVRIGMAGLSPGFHQQPPFEQDVFSYRQNPPRECWPQCQRQPVVQLGTSRRVFLKFNAKANFSDIYDAEIELVERLPLVKRGHSRFRP